MPGATNRQIVLCRRPRGESALDDGEGAAAPVPHSGDGEERCGAMTIPGAIATAPS